MSRCRHSTPLSDCRLDAVFETRVRPVETSVCRDLRLSRLPSRLSRRARCLPFACSSCPHGVHASSSCRVTIAPCTLPGMLLPPCALSGSPSEFPPMLLPGAGREGPARPGVTSPMLSGAPLLTPSSIPRPFEQEHFVSTLVWVWAVETLPERSGALPGGALLARTITVRRCRRCRRSRSSMTEERSWCPTSFNRSRLDRMDVVGRMNGRMNGRSLDRHHPEDRREARYAFTPLGGGSPCPYPSARHGASP